MSGKPVYINLEHMGHFYPVDEKRRGNTLDERGYTGVGVTTHNNGGLHVQETPEQILNLIDKLK